MKTKYNGNDNYGKPKVEYLEKLCKMDENELSAESESKIWLSAYAENNPRSDYHWQADACYDECNRRGRMEIYTNAYNKVKASLQ